jgi:hypothetical protein
VAALAARLVAGLAPALRSGELAGALHARKLASALQARIKPSLPCPDPILTLSS